MTGPMFLALNARADGARIWWTVEAKRAAGGKKQKSQLDMFLGLLYPTEEHNVYLLPYPAAMICDGDGLIVVVWAGMAT